MVVKEFAELPAGATIRPGPFEIDIPEAKLRLMKDLVSLSPIGPVTYENTTDDENYGVSHAWLSNAKHVWETQFDWRKHEARLNTFPHFTTSITDEQTGIELTVHFVALFSKKQDAVPLSMYHGWPGSFLEHLGILSLLKEKYTPETLPYHVVVPSLTGFTFSSGPPTDRDFDAEVQARIFDNLMRSLFGETGYVAHGGDIGQAVALHQTIGSDACKALHLNNVFMKAPENADRLDLSDLEKKVFSKRQQFMTRGSAYAMEHGTKPATIGLALSASPLALLAWIGEKYLAWTDEDPPLERILETVSLYYLTDTFPRCLWNYRTFVTKGARSWPQIQKPVGYSFFPQDLAPLPLSWLKTSANVVWHHEHELGGHFPGLEKPQELVDDLEAFIKVAWK